MSAAMQLPRPEDLAEPYRHLASWAFTRHPDLHRVDRDASVLIAQLEHVTSLRVSLNTEQADTPELAAAMQTEADDFSREVLQLMRDLHLQLTTGLTIRRVRQDLGRLLPQRVQPFDDVLRRAAEQLAEMRAALAFIVDENDDAELGIELVHAAGEPLAPRPSVPASF